MVTYASYTSQILSKRIYSLLYYHNINIYFSSELFSHQFFESNISIKMKHSHSDHQYHHDHHDHHHHHETMKAVEFDGKAFNMSIKTLPIPKLRNAEDAIIRVTSTGICGKFLRFTPSIECAKKIILSIHNSLYNTYSNPYPIFSHS